MDIVCPLAKVGVTATAQPGEQRKLQVVVGVNQARKKQVTTEV